MTRIVVFIMVLLLVIPARADERIQPLPVGRSLEQASPHGTHHHDAQNDLQHPTVLPDASAVEHVELSLPHGLLSGFPVIDKALSMEEAVRIGLQNNTDIQTAEAETGIRQALLQRARAKGWPVLSTGSLSFLHSRDSRSLMTPDMMMNTGESTFFQDFNATARMPLFTGGRIRAEIKASRYSLDGALAGSQQSAVEAAYRIREAYLEALLSEAEHLVHQQHITLQEELLRDAEARYRVGRGLKADVLRIQTEIASARQMMNEQHSRLNSTLFELKAEMGIDLGSDVRISDSLHFTPWTGADLPLLIQSAIADNPRIRELKAKIHEAEAQLRAEKSAWLPQVYGQVTGNLRFRDDPPMMGNGVVGMVTASLPVFDRNRGAAVAEAEARLKRAQQELKAETLTLGKNIAQAWTEMQFAAENEKLTDAAINQAQEDFRLIRRRADVGRAIQAEVQDVALQLREAGLNEAVAAYRHELAKARLWLEVGQTDSD